MKRVTAAEAKRRPEVLADEKAASLDTHVAAQFQNIESHVARADGVDRAFRLRNTATFE